MCNGSQHRANTTTPMISILRTFFLASISPALFERQVMNIGRIQILYTSPARVKHANDKQWQST